jgi:hypothetical protein
VSTRGALFRCTVPVLLLGTPWLPACGPCHCPAASISLLVASTDGGVVPNVDAFLTDPSNPSAPGERGQCTPYDNETDCFWYASALDAGSYNIRVAAPGFQTANVAVTVSRFVGNPGARCSCPGATLSPSSVALVPAGP